MIDKGRCDNGFIWNSSTCECECHKSSDVKEYLDYENYKCRKRLIDMLVEECGENIDGNDMIYNYKKVCNSCTVYIILLVISSTIIICIISAFSYFHWYLKISNTNINTDTVIYKTYKWEVSKK